MSNTYIAPGSRVSHDHACWPKPEIGKKWAGESESTPRNSTDHSNNIQIPNRKYPLDSPPYSRPISDHTATPKIRCLPAALIPSELATITRPAQPHSTHFRVRAANQDTDSIKGNKEIKIKTNKNILRKAT